MTFSFTEQAVNICKNDPSKLCLLKNPSYELVSSILKIGSYQPIANDLPGKQFPKDNNGRRFHSEWYWMILPDGKSVEKRNWLSYSPITDRVYCMDCILFSNSTVVKDKPNLAWTKYGFNTWVHGKLGIERHGSSSSHISCSMQRLIRQSSLPIFPSLFCKKKEEIIKNHEIVKQLIDITIYLGRHSLAFRGHREGWTEQNRGNFKDLIELISKYSPIMAQYLTELYLQKHKPENSFISWRKQNMLIDSISECISNVIDKTVNDAKFFSISIDSTFDISKKEQVSFVVRYVDEENECVKERLLALKESASTQGIDLANLFKDVCLEHNLDWKKYLVGQAYDGASNMRGQYCGLQSIIRTENPSAIYVWCWAHRLNLVVVDAVSSGTNAMDLFGNLEQLFDFLSSSKKRVALFEKKQREIYPKNSVRRVKKVSTTRWMSHYYALYTVIVTFDAIIETLYGVRNIEGPGDRCTGVIAGGLLKYFTTEIFLFTAFSFENMFKILETTSKLLQSPDFDIICALTMIENNLNYFAKLRTV